LPPCVGVVTIWGEIDLFKLLKISEIITCTLKIFSPPVVDPVHPPINISINNKTVGKAPHSEKLVVAYPVPVMIDIELKEEILRDSKKE
tara:strand:+ start:318 stop:584 length:267 start_codon:yes stop_codon:yes gene_type:complete